MKEPARLPERLWRALADWVRAVLLKKTATPLEVYWRERAFAAEAALRDLRAKQPFLYVAGYTSKGKSSLSVLLREPVAGESWFLNPKGPWPRQWGPVAVKIIDVKCGYVRYDMGAPFNDERLEVQTFIKIYSPQPKQEL